MDNLLSVKNLVKSYAKSDVFAVNDVSFDVKPGDIFGFLGPNGAGKTTTIKMITGILSIGGGSVSVCGADIATDAVEAKRNIGYVPDGSPVYDKLTGTEYLNFMADVYRVSAADRKRRAEELLARFGLTDAANQQIRAYSHGMKQKITVIGALLHDPKLWILDEPMTGLDPQSVFELKTLMREHCAKGNAVFFSTHVLDVAEKICDRVAIIAKGKIILDKAIADNAGGSLEQIFLAVTK